MIRLAATLFAFIVCAPVMADDLQQLEARYGKDPLAAALGNGRFTVGVDESGRVCALRWPSPGYYSHLEYDSASVVTGMSWGLVREETIHWSHSTEWKRESASFDDKRYLLALRNESLGIGARVTAFVDPAVDRLEYRIDFDGALSSDRVLWFSAIRPETRIVPELPLFQDFVADADGFASFADASMGALIQFRPAQPGLNQWERADQLADSGASPETWKKFGAGSWFASSFNGAADYRCVAAADEIAELTAGRIPPGGAAAIGSTAAGLMIGPIESGSAVMTVRAAESFRDFVPGSIARIAASTHQPRHALIETIITHQDRESGSVVRGIAQRPAINRDWPRYGAWAIRALDLAGETDRAERLIAFYLRRLSQGDQLPEGALPFALYPNGDSAALASLVDTEGAAWVVWASTEHARMLNVDERAVFLESHWDSLVSVTDFIVNWAEDTRGIPWHAYDPVLGRDRRDRSQVFTGHLALASMISFAEAENKSISQPWIRRKAQWDALMHSYRQDADFKFGPEDPLPFWAPEIFPADQEPMLSAVAERLDAIHTNQTTAAARTLAEIALVKPESPALRTQLQAFWERVNPEQSRDARTDSYLASTAYVALVIGLGESFDSPTSSNPR